MTLKQLQIGDIFYPRKLNKKVSYEVIDHPEYNPTGGYSVRMCLNLITQTRECKSCRLQIVKL